MNSALLISILGLIWANHAQSNVPFKKDFDLNKFSGFWYVIGMATDSEQLMAPKGEKKMAGSIVSVENGQIRLKFSYHQTRGCQVENLVGKEIISGKYDFPGKRVVYISDTDYQDYAVLYITAYLDGENHDGLMFYSRTKDPSENGKKQFMKISQTGFHKYNEDQIVMLQNDDECIKALDE
ncbi:epididymal-specific lipocalin-5-like isoform X2 [Ornithorhynchus anatinus]|nr:epididymal-specific lipocalin-5-like isoform X2 [Ornithorhynchus anatinus]